MPQEIYDRCEGFNNTLMTTRNTVVLRSGSLAGRPGSCLSKKGVSNNSSYGSARPWIIPSLQKVFVKETEETSYTVNDTYPCPFIFEALHEMNFHVKYSSKIFYNPFSST